MSDKEEQQRIGWVDDPQQLEKTIAAVSMEMSADRMLSRFYLAMRYARPTTMAPDPDRSTTAMPAFLDSMNSIVRQVGFNGFLEATDACTARICHPLRPRVLPVAAKPDINRGCTLLGRMIDGVFETCDFLSQATQAWEDSYCVPVGLVGFRIEPQTKQIIADRADPTTFYWHRAEGRNPIHLYREEQVSKTVLKEQHPDFADDIDSAPAWSPVKLMGVDPAALSMTKDEDTVRVCHGWRRKLGDENGYYVKTCNGIVLNGEIVDGKAQGEVWKYDFFPFAAFRNRWDFRGFGGIPMGRFIAPHHMALNRICRIIEDSLKGAVPWFTYHKDSGLNGDEISDTPWQGVPWDGPQPPNVFTPNPVSSQALAERDYHREMIYAIAGVNRMLAAGQKPAGVTAASAIREVIDLADARLNEYQKFWEAGYRQAGHIVCALVNDIKGFKVKAGASAELMEEIRLSDLNLSRDDYRIQYGLTSALSTSVAGRMQDAKELQDLGVIGRPVAARIVAEKTPDIAKDVDMETAPWRMAEKMVENAIDKGVMPVVPGPTMGQEGIDAVIMLSGKAWCASQINPTMYSPRNREVLRRLNAIAKTVKAGPAPAPQPVLPATPIPAGAIVPQGVAAGVQPRIAHNQYEAASMGIGQPTQ